MTSPGEGGRRAARGRLVAIAIVALVAVGASAAGDAAAAKVLPLPRVSASTKQIRHRGHLVVVVRSVLVRRIHGELTVSCNKCLRLVGRIRTTRPSRTSKRFSGVNWILSAGHVVKVSVTQSRRIGRFLLLSAKRRKGRLRLVYKESGCLSSRDARRRCPSGTPAVTPSSPVPVIPPQTPTGPVTPPPPPRPPPPLPPPPPPPPPPVAPPATTDTFPCEAPVTVSWTTEKVQRCALVFPVAPNGWIPVYTRPVAKAATADYPTPTAGWLHGTVNQYFVCQREFVGVEYYYSASIRNRWWAYTLSDDNKWGWTPQIFFKGGNNDERDAGLVACGANHT